VESAFRSFCESTGVSGIARDIGFIDNSGDIQQLKEYDSTSTKIKTEKVQIKKEAPDKKRKRPTKDVEEEDSDDDDNGKKGKSAKTNKGLRHFSKKVCEKVERKGKTTYNEVADELVLELTQGTEATAVDSKNIRRRVYDALNVLMAMQIIEKDKKEIQWRGLPQPSKDSSSDIQSNFTSLKERVEKKREQLAQLDSQKDLYQKLIALNQTRDGPDTNERLPLPFIIVQTRKETIINCEMSPDRDEYFFDFSMPFSIFDDNEILNHLDLGGRLPKLEQVGIDTKEVGIEKMEVEHVIKSEPV